MKYACSYGADAVYFGVPDFSLRARINKFSEKTLKEGVEYVHSRKKKVYVTLNIYAHNKHIAAIEKHLKFLRSLKIDGVIASDPGIINLVKKHLPKVDIHLSTQANATNWQAVKFWKEIGVSRVILAREVSLGEIREIKKKVPGIELEYFVHGAMCMSYSGRCILSKWMTGRSANLGDCSQPCRWPYHRTWNIEHGTKGFSIKDDKNKYEMDIEENKHGTYFFNSYDMNLIEHVKDLIDAGVTSLKIEGRAKSVYYVAVVTRAYRKVIDAAVETRYSASKLKKIIEEQKSELNKLTNRGYSKGFLLGAEPPHDFSDRNRYANFDFVGEMVGDQEDGRNKGNLVRVHNALYQTDKLEAITPEANFPIKILEIRDRENKKTQEAHGGSDKNYLIRFDKDLKIYDLIRRQQLTEKRK